MLNGGLRKRMESWTLSTEFETMTDRFAEDVAGVVVKGMPTDGRSLEDAIRVAFKRGRDGMSREILTDRTSEDQRIAG